jgi:hypothetical protein
MIWSTVEIQLAIICACMPSLRVLYRLIVRPSFSNMAHQRYYTRNGSSDVHDLEERTPSLDGMAMEETRSEVSKHVNVKQDGESMSMADRSGSSLL